MFDSPTSPKNGNLSCSQHSKRNEDWPRFFGRRAGCTFARRLGQEICNTSWSSRSLRVLFTLFPEHRVRARPRSYLKWTRASNREDRRERLLDYRKETSTSWQARWLAPWLHRVTLWYVDLEALNGYAYRPPQCKTQIDWTRLARSESWDVLRTVLWLIGEKSRMICGALIDL